MAKKSTFILFLLPIFIGLTLLTNENYLYNTAYQNLSKGIQKTENLKKLTTKLNCTGTDSDNDGICDEDDLDDDNDGILDVDESCTFDDTITTITPNGYDTQALQAGFHGALYKLVNGGYAITGVQGLPDGEDAFTITEISTANGYERADDILIGTYGGYSGGALFLLSNGDWASTEGFEPADSNGWSITRAIDGPALPDGVSPFNVRVLNIHFNSTRGQFFLTMLDDRGNLYYNGDDRQLILGRGFRPFLETLAYPDNYWEPFPNLPNGVKVKSYDASVGRDDKIIVLGDDNNLYSLGRRIYVGDGTPHQTTATWVRLTSPVTPESDIIQVSTNGWATYVLDSSGKLFGLGRGFVGSSPENVEVPVWSRILDQNEQPLESVAYISSTNNDVTHQASTIILSDGTIRSWGENNRNMIGVNDSQTTEFLPTIPFTAPGILLNEVTMVENGTHITPIIQNGEVYNVGHRLEGGFGDGISTSADRYFYDRSNLPGELDFVADNPPAPCIKDTDNDGIPDLLDTDSDNDGCPDALEGGNQYQTTDLDNDNRLSGPVDANGIPVIAANGQDLGSSDQHHSFELDMPLSIAFCPGSVSTFYPAITNEIGIGELTYTWYSSSDNGNTFEEIDILGNILEFIPNMSDDGLILKLEASSSNNSCTVESLIELEALAVPYAGLDASITVCRNNISEIDLYEVLEGEDFGGVWNRDNGTGGEFDAFTGAYTRDYNASDSVFSYTVFSDDCPQDVAFVTINILDPEAITLTSTIIRPKESFPNSTIVVNASGNGLDKENFEYALDDKNGFYQQLNQFRDVPPGTHTIYSRGIEGCIEESSISIHIINYPNVFTPNNDGVNDTWYVLGLDDKSVIQNPKIWIFNRYGAFIQEMDGNSSWDGTFNNTLLPENDYWFKLQYTNTLNGKFYTERGNFTLKR